MEQLKSSEIYLKALIKLQEETKERFFKKYGKKVDFAKASMLVNYGFSTRTLNALKKKGIYTLDQLIKIPKDSIKDIYGCGPNVYVEIVDKVHDLGLFFYSEYFDFFNIKSDKSPEDCIEHLKLEQEEYTRNQNRTTDVIILENIGVPIHVTLMLKDHNILTLKDLLNEETNNISCYIGLEEAKKLIELVHGLGLKFRDELVSSAKITPSEINEIKKQQNEIMELNAANRRKKEAIEQYENASAKLKEAQEKTEYYDGMLATLLKQLKKQRNSSNKSNTKISKIIVQLSEMLSLRQDNSVDNVELLDEIIELLESAKFKSQSKSKPKVNNK